MSGDAFDYVRPADLAEALAVGAETGSAYLAGGTDLMPLWKVRAEAPARVVDIPRLPLGEIATGASLRLGALGREPRPRHLWCQRGLRRHSPLGPGRGTGRPRRRGGGGAGWRHAPRGRRRSAPAARPDAASRHRAGAGRVDRRVASRPWRLAQCEAALVGQPPTQAVFEGAAALAVEGAQPLEHNGFKIELLRRAVRRAFETVGGKT